MAKAATQDPTSVYFSAINAALKGLAVFMQDERAGVKDHALIADAVSGTIEKLQRSLVAFANKQAFSPGLRIAQGESGFPAFQHILELTADRAKAEVRLGQLASAETLRASGVRRR